MQGFIIKAIIRLLAILVPIAIIQVGLLQIPSIQPPWLQIPITILLFIFAIALALGTNWVAKFIPYNGARKGK